MDFGSRRSIGVLTSAAAAILGLAALVQGWYALGAIVLVAALIGAGLSRRLSPEITARSSSSSFRTDPVRWSLISAAFVVPPVFLLCHDRLPSHSVAASLGIAIGVWAAVVAWSYSTDSMQ
jgi:hypothetical protein